MTKDKVIIILAIFSAFMIFIAFYAEAEGYRNGYIAGKDASFERQAEYNRGYYKGYDVGYGDGFCKGSGLAKD